MAVDTERRAGAPVVYVTDASFERYDPADLYDLAFALRASELDLRALVVVDAEGSAARILDKMAWFADPNRDIPATIACAHDSEPLNTFLQSCAEPVSLVVVAGYSAIANLLENHAATVRKRVARIFVVGGHANWYGDESRATTIPIDPRLRDLHPERFLPSGDPRVQSSTERDALHRILTSGEAVIWLPRDICLWRYASAGILENGGASAQFLLREQFSARFAVADGAEDRWQSWSAPVLLSALPALLLAAHPDTSAWLRMFRAVPAHVEVTDATPSLQIPSENPNLYCVVAIDGVALGKMLTKRLLAD